jgi:aminopeptidase N
MPDTHCATANVNSGIAAFSAWGGACDNKPNGYGNVVYGRAAVMIDAIRSAMGSSAFFSAMAAYIAAHRYGMVAGYDLLKYLDSRTTRNLGATFCPYVSYC